MVSGDVSYGDGRRALLEAAVRVTARQGLRGLTNRAVAAEAGVTHGLVAFHFGTRDRLIEEALGYSVGQSLEGVAEVPAGAARDGLEGLAERLGEFVRGNEEHQAFQFELALEARRRPELRSIMAVVNETYRARARAELLRSGLEGDEELVELVYAALDGLVFHQVTVGGGADIDAVVERFRSVLSAYAAARGLV